MKTKLLATIAALAGFSAPAMAATQGTPGPTSTGTVTINASITPEVNITNLDDITFPATSLITTINAGFASNVRDDAVCVWSNNPDGSYFITATGQGAGGTFTLTNGTDTINYGVQFGLSVATRTDLTAGVKSAAFRSNATQPDCGGGTTANLAISLSRAEIASMDASTTYTGVLTLLVSPT